MRGHIFSAWLFLRVVGVLYAIAFLSLGVQVKGLIGRNGVLPAREFLVHQKSMGYGFWSLPTLCWWNCNDWFLCALCWTGFACGLLVCVGLAPPLTLLLCWVCYLSLFNVGQIFLGYQWDVLLLESGFLAIFLAPLELMLQWPPSSAPSPITIGLLYWLLFRLMFQSGYAKLRSRDQTWRNLSALCHHYQTQPLPTPVAWYAWQLPRGFHRISAVVMFVIELTLPFLIFTEWRYIAAFGFIALMVLIQLTGNYGFFNLAGVALALLLLDDRFYQSAGGTAPSREWPEWALWIVFGLIILLSIDRLLSFFRVSFPWPRPITRLLDWLDRWHLVNNYGLFSVMTTERPEIIVEGSYDGVNWRAYEFKFKPGQGERAPRWAAPHQPRLDWQMWFAALGDYQGNPWLLALLLRLLQSQPAVLKLLAKNPFIDKSPHYVRAVVYDYRFTTRAERSKSTMWWKRERKWLYCPVLSLRGIERDLMPPKDFT